MDFALTAEQATIRDTVRALARRELAPGYLERATGAAFPWDVHRRIAELGVFGMLAGPEYNLLDDEDYVLAGLVVEELAYGDFNVANAVIPVFLMSSLVARYATPEIRKRRLEPLVSGETYLAFGLTEPHSGSDAAALRMQAVADGDGYVLTGEKTSVTMLAHAEAMIVTARTVRDGRSTGVSAFLVGLDQAGVSKADIPDTGWKTMGRGVLRLDGVRVSRDALLGEEGSHAGLLPHGRGDSRHDRRRHDHPWWHEHLPGGDRGGDR